MHVKVRLPGRELLTTQMCVAGDPDNARDPLWWRLGPAQRAALTVPLVRSGDGATAQFAIMVQA